MATYERWAAWRKSYELTLEVYRITASFPKHELYGLTSQTRRAAFSIVSNIAEGSAKRGAHELRRYLDIALGSLSELSCGLRLARDLGILSEADSTKITMLHNHAGVLLWKLYDAVRKQTR